MKNKEQQFKYNMEELVKAYPDQEFLKTSEVRALARLKQLRKKEARVIIMRRVLSAAAVILMIICAARFIQVRTADTGGPTQGNIKDPIIKPQAVPAGRPVVSLPTTTVNTSTTAASTASKKQVYPLPDSGGILINHQQKMSNARPVNNQPNLVAQEVNAWIPDSAQPNLVSTKNPKTIPLSVNEFSDAILKFKNSKPKPHPARNEQKALNVKNMFNQPDTLFPTSFN